MRKVLFLLSVIILLASADMYAQKELSRGVYMYGSLTNELKEKTLVIFLDGSPKTTNALIKRLKKSGINAVSYTDYAMPGEQLNDEEYGDLLAENNIKVIMYISHDSAVSESRVTSTTYNNLLGVVTAPVGIPVGTVALSIKFYNIKDNFAKPTVIVYTEMSGTWRPTYAKSGDGLTKSCLKKLLDALERHSKKNS